MIAVVDYGLGNVRAILNIYDRAGIPAIAASCPEELERASGLILPGVGAFDWAMSKLRASGLAEVLNVQVVEKAIPVLGICVGMQMMASGSDEGSLPGLSWIPGYVRKFSTRQDWPGLPAPHMGWNDLDVSESGQALFDSTFERQSFYFLHSYYFDPAGTSTNVLATADYGGAFASAVGCKNATGVQFHPEKSHRWGESLLIRFAVEVCGCCARV